jgi:hypothetical protein
MNQRLIIIIFLIIVTITTGSIAGCSTASTTNPPTSQISSPTSGNSISFAHDIQPIFNQNCTICHQGNQNSSGLNLQNGSAYKNLVNVKSNQSSLLRVLPGHPDQSYLINKLLGTQAEVGGSGRQMPYEVKSSLPQTQINLIQRWISEIALNN